MRAAYGWLHRLSDPSYALPSGASAVRLPDGTRAYIYPLPHTGGAALAVGLQELSPASRYQRFLSSRERFTRSELDFLTNCDGVDHIALVLAVEVGRGEKPRPVAVARCIRDFADPELSEVAIAVSDRRQGCGVGGVLLGALHAQAWDTGVRRWRAFLFAENVAMLRLLDRVGELVSREFDGPGCVETIYDLRPPAAPPLAPLPNRGRAEWTPLICIAASAVALLAVSGVMRWTMRRTGTSGPDQPHDVRR